MWYEEDEEAEEEGNRVVWNFKLRERRQEVFMAERQVR